jgi:hypothetical protein
MMLALTLGCGKKEPPPPAAERLPLIELGDFDYTEGMALPDKVTRWNRKPVIVTGYVNPTRQTREISRFLLVKDLGSCCFGKAPQINHFIDVALKDGQTVNYSRDPVTVRGVLEIGEVMSDDGVVIDSVYRMKGGEVVK